MGDSKRIRSKGKDRINRIVSLFEIPRPNKSARTLQRTNSLPPSKIVMGTTEGKVMTIKRKIEEKSHEAAVPIISELRKGSPTKPITLSHKCETDKRVNEYLNNRKRIKDVSEELEEGSYELEITYERASEGSDDSVSIGSMLSALSSDTIRGSHDSSNRGSREYDSFTSYNVSEEKTSENSAEQLIQEESLQNSEYYLEFSRQIDSMTARALSDEEHESTNNAQPEFNFINAWRNKTFVQVSHESAANADDSDQPQNAVDRFIKNKNRTSMTSRRDRRRTGFKDAAKKGETEMYRKSVIDELDKELENMKNDGFNEELYRSLSNDPEEEGESDEDVMGEKRWNEEFGSALSRSIENLRVIDNDDQDFEMEEHSQLLDKFRNLYVPSQTEQVLAQQDDDPFGETYFGDGLESGLVYLEAYNQDDRELVECTVQVDRKSVDLQRFNELQAGSNTLLTTNKAELILLGDSEGDDSKRNTIYSTTSGESYEGDIKTLSEDSGTDSKRNTIYSTTSGDSYEDEDTMYPEEEPTNYSAARRETYCDDHGRVRIERVAQYQEKSENFTDYVNTVNQYYEHGNEKEQRQHETEDNDYESIKLEHDLMFFTVLKKDKILYILEEIVSTERKYVSDMERVLKEYKEFLKRKDATRLEDVFGNMPKIYKLQKQFLRGLEVADSNVDAVIAAFIEFKDLFALYPVYFKNTPKSNAAVKELSSILKERQEEIGDKLDLSAYLLTPLQRLGKYKLFLENIIKQLTKDDHSPELAKKALEMIKKFLRKGNDAVAIASILLSPIHPKDYGSFISREKFSMTKPKKMDVMVFLFEKIVIFTVEDMRNMEHFVYNTSIKTNDLRIATFENNCLIHLTDFTKTKRKNSSKYTYVLDAKNPKTKEAWKLQIEEILWDQMMKLKADSLKKIELTATLPRRTHKRVNKERNKSLGSSVFYVE